MTGAREPEAGPGTHDVCDRAVVVPSHVFVREFDGELVLLDLEGGDYFGLSELGLVLWNGLSAGKTPREVAIEAVASYDVDLPTMTRDFSKLTEELLAKGLLLPKPAT